MFVEIKNVTKSYNIINDIKLKALDQINLILKGPGLVFITGDPGSGKTTLLNIMAGIEDYDDGAVVVNGQSLDYFKKNKL